MKRLVLKFENVSSFVVPLLITFNRLVNIQLK